MIQHMRCPRVKERDIEFDSHMSGFVYKVRVNDEILIKKEIPGPDTVDEFLYEINALNRLRHSHHVIRFHGVIVDDNDEYVKGLLISYAERGALIDVIYDQIYPMPWSTRERWARQIISGLSEIHEAGFVQGDFTLSNIVIDEDNNAKIIDINRRGCPVGWEPPEATPLIESNQRISMYIGVKSDLYQLGMVLWAVAMKEDEPEAHGRPLRIGSEVLDVPDWYRSVVGICLSEDPRNRLQALQLLSYFPERVLDADMDGLYDRPSISVDDGVTRKEYFVDSHPSADGYPQIRTVHPASEWSYVGWSPSYLHSPHDDPYFYPARGRSPPSPMPSNPGEYESSRYDPRTAAWASTYGNGAVAPSESEAAVPDLLPEGKKSVTPRTSRGSVSAPREINGLGFNGSVVPTGLSAEEVEESTSAGTPGDGNVTLKVELQSEQSAGTTEHSESAHNLTEEDNIGGMRDFVELGTTQHMHTDLQGPSDTGNTEPELINNNSKGLVRSYSDATTTQALEPDSSNIPSQPADTVETGERPDTVEGAGILPASVQSEPSSESTEKATESPPRDRMGKTSTEALAPMVEPSPRAPSSTSRHSGSSSTLRDLPDDLRGVGSTYDLLSEKRLDSISDDDLTMFINTDIDRDSITTAQQ
jgi:serine/threonine protein kinase